MKFATLALLAGTLLIAAATTGCDSYTYDPGTYFPETWDDDYVQISECAKSGDHSGHYVTVWAPQAVADRWNAKTHAYEAGDVILKPQYEDSACTDLSVWTVMRKGDPGTAPASGDWEWQNVSRYGDLQGSGQVTMCIGCHTAYKDTDFVATQP